MNPLFYALGAVAAIELAMGARLLYMGAVWRGRWWQTTLALVFGGILVAIGLHYLIIFITKGVLA